MNTPGMTADAALCLHGAEQPLQLSLFLFLGFQPAASSLTWFTATVGSCLQQKLSHKPTVLYRHGFTQLEDKVKG